MSDVEGSPQEQPGSPEEEMEDQTETNGDHPEESEDADQEAGSRKRSLSTSDKEDESPSKKVAKEEVSLAIICDSHAKALEKIKQTETAIVFHLKVKVTEELSLATIPSAVEDVLSEDPETKCIVIVLPQDDLRQTSIPQSCKMHSCSGREIQHKLPLPITSLPTYVNTLKKTREELLETYPDTEFYWVTPGPVDFRQLNQKEIEKKHGHPVTPDFMWKNIISNYNKRLKVITDEISGDLTLSWFARSGWRQKGGNKGKKALKAQSSIYQRMLHGDLGPVREAGFIEKGEILTAKGAQEMWMMIRKKIHWYRMSQSKAENEAEDDPSAATEEDQQNGEEVNGKAEEDAPTENDANDSQKKKSNTVKTTVIGDTWLQVVSDVERWQPDNRHRMNIKIFPDLTLDSVIERVDEVLTEKTDTENLVLSIFQNDISNGISAEYIEDENLPCVFSIVEELLEKASDIKKYLKKNYPKIKVVWVAPGPVGYYSEEDKKEEEKSKEEKKEEKEADEEDKADDEKEDDDKDEDKDDEDKDDDDKAEGEEKVEDKKIAAEVVEEEEKEEDPETKQLRRACSRCNTIAMVLNKRLHIRFKKHVVSWFDIFSTTRSGSIGNAMSSDQKLEGQILEGKIVTHGYLDEDYVNLSEMGGNRLMRLIISTIQGKEAYNMESDVHGSPGINKGRGGGMRGRLDAGGRGGRGMNRGRGGGGGMGRPIDKRLSWDSRGSAQHNPWGQQGGGGNWKGQQRRFQGQDMREIINRERSGYNQRANWGGSGQYVEPWARNDYSGYYSQRY